MKDLKSVARYVMRGDPAILRKKIEELYKRIYFMRRWRRKKKAKKAEDRRYNKLVTFKTCDIHDIRTPSIWILK